MMMREAFGNTIAELMRKDERICVLDADLANCNGTAGLRKEFPERAFDVGIAEQNMASVAAGLSSYGFIPFISSFTPFATRRICDQIAISIAYAKQNVKIVGSDPGISAQLNGGTHMSMEDIGVLRSIPTMVIFEPVDNEQMIQALPQIVDYNGPVYIRMFRKECPEVFGKDYKFDLFKADKIKEGKDVTIFASGIMVKTSLDAAEKLKAEGIDKHELGREGFLKRSWEWKKEYGGAITSQLRKIGSSCDWDRERFTMDEGCNKAVNEVFVRIYEKGLIYRGERIINWCPHCKTSISDAEV
ncbi:MAG: class I tRNA ligase family protein, partial [Oscillospiraceae bacterium]|nr:class I tRNA ligase family protein [Oscillospiraceae bacterium]